VNGFQQIWYRLRACVRGRYSADAVFPAPCAARRSAARANKRVESSTGNDTNVARHGSIIERRRARADCGEVPCRGLETEQGPWSSSLYDPMEAWPAVSWL
jgi:hypothetical protein